MKTLLSMTKRNVKLFFADKGMFITSLITPMILLVLYATFLGNVFESAFLSGFPQGMEIDEKLVNGFVGAQLVSSILAVSCVTVAFCANMLMVQDKANGSIRDLEVSPLDPRILAVSYYLGTLISTLLICLCASAVCFVYIAAVGWYFTLSDVLLILLDVLILSLFGTAMSSLVNFFLSSQGQISAVGTIVSSGYGFLCGAYMPISQFDDSIGRVISLLPGTFGTSLLRQHSMAGVEREMIASGMPNDVIKLTMDSVDANIYISDTAIPTGTKLLVIILCIVLVLGIYVALNMLRFRRMMHPVSKKQGGKG